MKKGKATAQMRELNGQGANGLIAHLRSRDGGRMIHSFLGLSVETSADEFWTLSGSKYGTVDRRPLHFVVDSIDAIVD